MNSAGMYGLIHNAVQTYLPGTRMVWAIAGAIHALDILLKSEDVRQKLELPRHMIRSAVREAWLYDLSLRDISDLGS